MSTADDMTFGSNVLDVPTNVTRDPLETVDEVILRVSNESAKLLARFQEHFRSVFCSGYLFGNLLLLCPTQ